MGHALPKSFVWCKIGGGTVAGLIGHFNWWPKGIKIAWYRSKHALNCLSVNWGRGGGGGGSLSHFLHRRGWCMRLPTCDT